LVESVRRLYALCAYGTNTPQIISKRFLGDPAAFADAFQRAWYKLTHRDMGPHARLLGPFVAAPQLWQDPVPPRDARAGALSSADAVWLKSACIAVATAEPQVVGLPSLVRAAWASASTYRCTDHRGGANGARVRLGPQKDWPANDPIELAAVPTALESVQAAFVGPPISMADLIVLAGCAAIEAAAQAAGHSGVTVPFSPGRTDTTDDMTDAASFAVLEPSADGFRNYDGRPAAAGERTPAEALLVDKAHMLKLSKAEMAVLVGGLRALGATAGQSPLGVLTATPGALNNAFFVNLLDMGTVWAPSEAQPTEAYTGKDRVTGALKWTASRVDLAFGSNSELRAVAEYYACDDGGDVFVADFVAAWAKVMNLDRFDLKVE
jgi:catalase-peroxidase